MFQLYANKVKLVLRRREVLTSGSVNVSLVQFVFSSDWEGLTRTVVFRTDSASKAVVLGDDNELFIPWEVLQVFGVHLFVGVYGAKNETTVLPTIWVDLGIIQEGTNPLETVQPPKPDLWEQKLADKQDKLIGLPGQIVGFDEEGNAIAQDLMLNGDGTQGPKGEKGDKGDPGEQGPKGDPGDGIPAGIIAIWSGTQDNIPSGWELCDGQDGRPDLRDRFVIGAGTKHSIGDTGGSEEVTLTVEQMPEHSHTYSLFSKAVSSIKVPTAGTSEKIVNSGSGNASTTTGLQGSSEPHPNMPPYYALCYIIKVTADNTDSAENL